MSLRFNFSIAFGSVVNANSLFRIILIITRIDDHFKGKRENINTFWRKKAKSK